MNVDALSAFTNSLKVYKNTNVDSSLYKSIFVTQYKLIENGKGNIPLDIL